MSVCRRAYARPQPRAQHGRHYLCVCVHSDIYRQVQQLAAEHQLSLSGAAHHLLRLGAGLDPLLPLPKSTSTVSSDSHGD
jgi:ribosomal protein L40E